MLIMGNYGMCKVVLRERGACIGVTMSSKLPKCLELQVFNDLQFCPWHVDSRAAEFHRVAPLHCAPLRTPVDRVGILSAQAQNMIDHEEDIMARPARSWFQTPKQKKAVAEAAKADAVGGGQPGAKGGKTGKKAAGKDGKMERGRREQQEPEDTKEERQAVARGIR